MLNIFNSTPEEVGIPSSAILHFLDRLKMYHIPMHSVLIMRHDKLAAECNFAPCTSNMPHRMFSISKSMTALAIGRLADEGKLSLDDPILSFFPQYATEHTHPWISSMTIRHLLMMRTCHADATYKPGTTKDWVGSFFLTPPSHKPGTVFHYDTSASHTLCALVENLTGQPMLEYLKDTMLRELGFSENSYIMTDPMGYSMGGSGLVCTAQDLLRLGYLLLHKGNVNGRQLISASYLEQAFSNLTPTAAKAPVYGEGLGYGYFFWRGEHNSFMAYGMGGQFILCFPDADMICVTTADNRTISGGNQLIFNSFYEEIIPYLTDKPIPQTPKSLSEQHLLQKKLNSASLVPVADFWPSITPQFSDIAAFNRQIYLLKPNRAGFTHLSVQWEDTLEGKLIFYKSNESDYTLPFGYRHVIPCRFPGNNLRCAVSGAWLATDTFYIAVHVLDRFICSVQIQLVFGKDDVTVLLRNNENEVFHEYNEHLYGTSVSFC